jgi:hypothetical protein
MSTHIDSDPRGRRTDNWRPETVESGPNERSPLADEPRPGPTATERSIRPSSIRPTTHPGAEVPGA